MTGAEMIAAERQRQIDEEGWTAEHDDQHGTNGMLVYAAAAYLHAMLPATLSAKNVWPWDLKLFKPTAKLSNLIKEGALLAAEIDRLQRLEQSAAQPENMV